MLCDGCSPALRLACRLAAALVSPGPAPSAPGSQHQILVQGAGEPLGVGPLAAATGGLARGARHLAAAQFPHPADHGPGPLAVCPVAGPGWSTGLVLLQGRAHGPRDP